MKLSQRDRAAVRECVFFCPECHGLFVFEEGTYYLFENEHGKFIKVWEKNGPFKLHDMYLIGEL